MEAMNRTDSQNNPAESDSVQRETEQKSDFEQEIQTYKDNLKEKADEEIQTYKDNLIEDAKKEIQTYKNRLKQDADKAIQTYKDDEIAALIEVVNEKKQKEMDIAEQEVRNFQKKREQEIHDRLAKFETDECARIAQKVEEYKCTLEAQYQSEAEKRGENYFRRLRSDADTEIAFYREEQMERINKRCASREALWKKRIREENMEHFYCSQKENARKISEIHQQMVAVNKLVSAFKEELFWNNMDRVFAQFRLIYNDIADTRNGYMNCMNDQDNPYLQSIVENLGYTLELIDDCMQDVGIYSYESNKGDPFHSQKHESSQSGGTIITKSLRKGFEYRNIEGDTLRVLQKEIVETEE